MPSLMILRVPRASLLRFAHSIVKQDELHPSTLASSASTAPSTLDSIQFQQILQTLGTSTGIPSPLLYEILQYCMDEWIICAEKIGNVYRLDPQSASEDFEVSFSQTKLVNAIPSRHLSAMISLPNCQLLLGTISGETRIYYPLSSSNPDGDGSDNPKPVLSNTWKALPGFESYEEINCLLWSYARYPYYSDHSSPHPLNSEPSGSPSNPMFRLIVCIGTNRPTLAVHDLESRQCVRTLQGHTGKISCISRLNPDSFGSSIEANGVYNASQAPYVPRIVTGSWDGTCRVWRLDTFECEYVCEGGSQPITSVTTLKRRCVVAGAIDGSIRVWKVPKLNRTRTSTSSNATGSSLVTADEPVSKSRATSLHYEEFPLSGLRPLISGLSTANSSSLNHLAFKYPISRTGQGRYRPDPVHSSFAFSAHRSSVSSLCGYYPTLDTDSSSKTHSFLISGGIDGFVRIWALEAVSSSSYSYVDPATEERARQGTWQCLLSLQLSPSDGSVYSLHLYSNDYLCVGMSGKCMNIWNLGKWLDDISSPSGEPAQVTSSRYLHYQHTAFQHAVRFLITFESLDLRPARSL